MSEAIKQKFGTPQVFLTSICTILGAILFLRFDYAVGHVGFLGTLGIVLIGHIVTIPTALAVSEIATNQKVEGGGVYFIISRSFGVNLGAAIGISLYLSQAISIAFYVIAFAEAFQIPEFQQYYELIYQKYGVNVSDPRFVSLPVMLLLTLLIIRRGANIGMQALYVVAAILLVSLVMFFLGTTDYEPPRNALTRHIYNPDDFFTVFAICFPAFTGMAAGVGLSGDLKDPKKSIPIGTMAATIVGGIIYILVALKLALSAPPNTLASGEMVMTQIAIWGPIIPIGLAAATISSAIGSVLVAPRTLQALAKDGIFAGGKLNGWFSFERKRDGEPVNSTIITCILAIVFVLAGDVNFVAQIIAMFFMVSYGAICLISFMEHFAADPAYRPVFKSRWYYSLIGAVACIYLMFKMEFLYASLSVVVMVIIYFMVTRSRKANEGMAMIFQGAIFQLSRQLQVFLQKQNTEKPDEYWRPSVVCVSRHSFDRLGAFDLMRWVSFRYGFGTYVHYIEDYLNAGSNSKAVEAKKRLLNMTSATKSRVYIDTLISPSYTSALAQIIQLPGVSGQENNTLMFEFSKNSPDNLKDIISNYNLIKSVDFDMMILGSSEKGFGLKQEVHVWITDKEYENANLMILLAYIIIGHADWKNATIKIFAVFPEEDLEKEQAKLIEMTKTGRLPISANNIWPIAHKHNVSEKMLIQENSRDADLAIIGFGNDDVEREGIDFFTGYERLGNVLFVNNAKEKEIK
ncbi:MAG: amino acid permease [Bacteroidetes bacterium]|nr:amino acid permease [Bacteroidota bacterium]